MIDKGSSSCRAVSGVMSFPPLLRAVARRRALRRPRGRVDGVQRGRVRHVVLLRPGPGRRAARGGRLPRARHATARRRAPVPRPRSRDGHAPVRSRGRHARDVRHAARRGGRHATGGARAARLAIDGPACPGRGAHHRPGSLRAAGDRGRLLAHTRPHPRGAHIPGRIAPRELPAREPGVRREGVRRGDGPLLPRGLDELPHRSAPSAPEEHGRRGRVDHARPFRGRRPGRASSRPRRRAGHRAGGRGEGRLALVRRGPARRADRPRPRRLERPVPGARVQLAPARGARTRDDRGAGGRQGPPSLHVA